MKKNWLNLSLIFVGTVILYLLNWVLYSNINRSYKTLGILGTIFGSGIISYGLINFANLNKISKTIGIIVLTILFTILTGLISIYFRTGFVM